MAAQQFEPMSSGQILDKVFRLYKENFVRFIATVAIIQVPLALLGMICLATGIVHIRPGEPLSIGMLVLLFINMIGQSLCSGALVKSISESYLGNEVTVSESYRFILPKLGTLIWASILVNLVVVVGFILLIVPGIIFLLVYYLTIPVIVLEGLKARKGMGRSKLLVKGNLGKVFVIGLVVILIGIIVVRVFQYFGKFLADAVTNPDIFTLIIQLSSLIGQVLVMPIGAVAVILLYYDMRIRKEGFDLEMLAKSIGAEGEGAVSDEQPPVQ